MRALLSFGLLVLLAACGSGGSSDTPAAGYCAGSFAGGSTSWACNNCGGLDPLDDHDDFAPSIDNDAASYTSFSVGAGGGEVIVRAVAVDGHTFPADVDAGTLMRFPPGLFSSISVRFNTYNSSTPVDAQQGGSTAAAGNVAGAGSDTYYGLTSSDAFDTLEAVVSVSGNSEPAWFRLYEFCGDK
jgi:hypothetical protein